MLVTFWKLLGRQTLCGTAFLALANLVQAQGLAIPQPTLPSVVQNAPMNQPITPVQAQVPAVQIPAALGVPSVTANVTPLAASSNTDDKARIERLEKQVQDLTNALKTNAPPAPVNTAVEGSQGGLNPADVRKIINGYFTEKEDAKKREDKAKVDAGYKVGTDLKMNVRWETPGLRFETANKDFSIHLGARFMYDNVWFDQNENLRSSKQVGELQDGTYFRRTRISADGTFWEVGEFNTEFVLENVSNGITALDDFYLGVNKIPFLGTIRAGHHKIPQGFEAGNVSSSRSFTFMERSAYGEAFYPDFGTGFWIGNNVLNERATWSAMAYRQQRGGHGVDFADGEYAASGRMTALPIYENEGRHWMHVGGSATYRAGRRPGNGLTGERSVSASGRPEIRDRSGDLGNSTAWVTTGTIIANSTSLFGLEFAYVRGPFSVQAEYGVAYFNDAFATIGGKKVSQGDMPFDGGYIAVAYFLTGEHRTYDAKAGRLASYYFKGPHTPFWAVRGDDGRLNLGCGAWEIAARYSHMNLNSRDVNGGVLDGFGLALNWYVNSNLRVQFDYSHNNRYNTAPGVIPGDVNVLGIRTEFKF